MYLNKSYGKIWIGKYLSPILPIQNGLKLDASLLWNIPFRRFNNQERQENELDI
jgi:hypothetical protein